MSPANSHVWHSVFVFSFELAICPCYLWEAAGDQWQPHYIMNNSKLGPFLIDKQCIRSITARSNNWCIHYIGLKHPVNTLSWWRLERQHHHLSHSSLYIWYNIQLKKGQFIIWHCSTKSSNLIKSSWACIYWYQPKIPSCPVGYMYLGSAWVSTAEVLFGIQRHITVGWGPQFTPSLWELSAKYGWPSTP